MYLQPVTTPLAGLVAALLRVQHLHHESFARSLDTLVEQVLDLIQVVCVAVLGERKLSLDGLERVVQQLATFSQCFLDSWLLFVSIDDQD